LVERETAGVETALLLEAFLNLGLVFFAIRLDQAHEHLIHLRLLIARHLRDGQARVLAIGPAEADCRFARPPLGQSHVALLAVEHLVHLVCKQGLVPEHVAGVMHFFVESAGRVPVEDRTTQRHVRLAVAVGPHRHVPAGHYHHEILARRAKQRDRLFGAPRLAARIVLELLEQLRIPIRIEQRFVHGMRQRLLLLREKLALDVRLGDLPVVRDVRAQEAALRMHVVPIEADFFALIFGQ
jgi:hypothetical protein